MSDYKVLGFYVRLDVTPGLSTAGLYDVDDVQEEHVMAEAEGATPDAAMANLFAKITATLTFNEMEMNE
jgi:hypothetical protein